MKTSTSPSSVASAASPLAVDGSARGLWETIIDHAELQVVEHLASRQCKCFVPSSDVAMSMLRLLDRRTLSCIVKERNYESLCGRFGCLLKPRVYQGRENSTGVVDWSMIEESEKEEWETITEDEPLQDRHTFGLVKNGQNGPQQDALEEDDIVYTEDYYTRESFRLAIKDQEKRQRYQRYQKQRKALSQGMGVEDRSLSHGYHEEEKGSQSSGNAPVVSRRITLHERFCSDECMQTFELDILARAAPHHVEYAHPDMIKAIGHLFPNLRLEVLLQLEHEMQRNAKNGGGKATGGVMGEIREKEISSPHAGGAMEGREDRNIVGVMDTMRREVLQSFLNNLKDMQQVWTNDFGVTQLCQYPSSGRMAWTSEAVTSTMFSTTATTVTCTGKTSRTAPVESTASSSAVMNTLPAPSAVAVKVDHEADEKEEKGDSLNSNKLSQSACGTVDSGDVPCPSNVPSNIVSLPVSSNCTRFSSPPSTRCGPPVDAASLSEAGAVLKKSTFLVHDFLLNVCGVRCGHRFLAHYAAHRSTLKGSWEKYHQGAPHRLPSRRNPPVNDNNSTPKEMETSSSTNTSMFERIAMCLVQRLEDTLQKLSPQLDKATEPFQVESGLEQQRRQQLAQHLFCAESTATLSRFLLVDETVVATAAWNGVWLAPPPSSSLIPTTCTRTSSKKVPNALSSAFHSLLFPFPIPSVLLKPLNRSPESLELSVLFVMAAACVHPAVLKEFLFEDARLEDIASALQLTDDDLEAALHVMLFSYD